MALRGELDDQDGVLGGKPDQRHQADLEIDVVVEAAQPDRQQRAQHGEGHRGQHRERQRPALVLRGQDQEHHDQAEDEAELARAAGRQLLVGRADPADGEISRQRLGDDVLHGGDRLAGRVARRGAAQDLGRREDVEAVDRVGTQDAGEGDQLVQRHHGAGVGADEDVAQVVRRFAEVGFGRQADAIGAAEQREVVDIEAAERALHGVEDRR